MTIEEIMFRHQTSHDAFIDFVGSLIESDYNFRLNNEKWDAGQQLDHISRTVGALSTAVTLPKVLLRSKFGKANRPSRSQEEIVRRYTEGISLGYKAEGKFIPEELSFKDRDKRLLKLAKKARLIENKVVKYSEEDLDTLILPHPAFKILTMREFMFFTIHHVEDHLSQTKRNLTLRDI